MKTNVVNYDNDYRWRLLQLRLYEKRIKEAVVFLRKNDVECILIKGWAAQQNYPDPALRGYTDIDLLIHPEKYDKTLQLLETYSERHVLDIHKAAKSLDSLSFEDLYKNSRKTLCGDQEINVLCAEDHLRVLCVHWLISGGARKDRLWDIYYAIENRPADFDWDKCLNVVSERRKRWIICTIGLTRKHLGLNLADTPLAEAAEDIPLWLNAAVEKEWASDTLLLPLDNCLSDRKILWRQIKKRIPPNPIQATIDMEGGFDRYPRILYQTGNVIQRTVPSISRIARTVLPHFYNLFNFSKKTDERRQKHNSFD